jgi:hypothetical protein
MTRREMNPEQQAELLRSNRLILEQYGFPDDLQQNVSEAILAAKRVFIPRKAFWMG